MNSLEARFGQLEVFLNEDSGKRTRFRGVPYFIFLYEPQYERKILSEVGRLEQRLLDQNIQVYKISMASMLFQILEEKGYLDRSFELETEDRESLRQVIGTMMKSKVIEHINSFVSESRKVILIVRTGSLFPFVKISSLLIELENHLRTPLVIFYPGKRENKVLYFLNEFEDHYYKGTII